MHDVGTAINGQRAFAIQGHAVFRGTYLKPAGRHDGFIVLADYRRPVYSIGLSAPREAGRDVIVAVSKINLYVAGPILGKAV